MTRSFVIVALLLSACSGTPATTTLLADPGGADVVIDMVYAEGFVTGTDPIVEVALGETVTISLVSDVADELHIHGGYELFVGIPRAREISFSFVADRPGVFDVYLESSHYLLFELDVG
jgi:hypothetical protein